MRHAAHLNALPQSPTRQSPTPSLQYPAFISVVQCSMRLAPAASISAKVKTWPAKLSNGSKPTSLNVNDPQGSNDLISSIFAAAHQANVEECHPTGTT